MPAFFVFPKRAENDRKSVKMTVFRYYSATIWLLFSLLFWLLFSSALQKEPEHTHFLQKGPDLTTTLDDDGGTTDTNIHSFIKTWLQIPLSLS